MRGRFSKFVPRLFYYGERKFQCREFTKKSGFVPTDFWERTDTSISKRELKERLGEIQIVDVREPSEVIHTGEIHETALNLPLNYILKGALGMEEEEFFEEFGFEKPNPEMDCVFVCKAGVRSRLAQQHARECYEFKSALNYLGGADEWFSFQDTQ